MADVNRGNRPLSPFMIGPIYRPQVTSVMSIAHRLTGIAMVLAGLMIVWWFLALASGPEAFARVDGMVTSWLGGLILLLSMLAFWYHFCNGVRHLAWDMGYGFGVDTLQKTAMAALVAAAVLSVVTLFFVW
jgi:succinate dehydrogenase / fumarate reductase, cytochrome b subunit